MHLSKWKKYRSSGNTDKNAINYTMAMFVLDVHQAYGFFCTIITLNHLPKTLSEIGFEMLSVVTLASIYSYGSNVSWKVRKKEMISRKI